MNTHVYSLMLDVHLYIRREREKSMIDETVNIHVCFHGSICTQTTRNKKQTHTPTHMCKCIYIYIHKCIYICGKKLIEL